MNPSKADYENSNEAHGNFRFTEGDNCIELDDGDYDLQDLPPNSRSQVPHFWKWWNFHPWCPTSDSAVMLNSNDKAALKAHIQGMTLSDGTGMDVGALWAAKVLSPTLRGDLGGDFPDRPFDFDTGVTNKILIVMADGGITAQYRPDDYSLYNTHDNRPSNNTNYGNGNSNSGNRRNEWNAIGGGNINSGTNRTSGRYVAICEAAHEQDITVFTIGYQITNSNNENLLKACASKEEFHFDVESLDIGEAFDEISAALDDLRLEQ